MSIVGRTYLERGEPVEIVAQWRGTARCWTLGGAVYGILGDPKVGGPRNVLIRRADGELIVRPFRGLRRAP